MWSKCFSYLRYKRKYSQMFIRSFEEFENVLEAISLKFVLNYYDF